MNGEFVITDHALMRFRERFNDPEATRLDIGRILAEAKVAARHGSRSGQACFHAILGDACFVLCRTGPGEYDVVTVLVTDKMPALERMLR